MNKWIKEVKTEDIPLNFLDLANEIGIEALLKMTSIIGGLTIYIPKTDFFIKSAKERLILQEYNGIISWSWLQNMGLVMRMFVS